MESQNTFAALKANMTGMSLGQLPKGRSKMLTPELLKPAALLIEASPRRDKTASISEPTLTFNLAGNKLMSHWPNSFPENYPCCWSLLFYFCSVLFCLIVLGFEPVISCTLGKRSTPFTTPAP